MRTARTANERRRERRQRGESGASDTLGTILMIAITVIAATGLAALVAEIPRPTREPQVDLDASIDKGAGGWGDGNEFVRVDHRGGETLLGDETTIVVRVGGTTDRFTGATLLSAFSDGRLTIGEAWTSGFYNITDTTAVDVDVLLEGGETQHLAATATLETPCASDTHAPTVPTWTQAPADVDVATSGDVTVTISLADDCAGVAVTPVPRLLYRLYHSVNPPDPLPDWIVVGDMAPVGPDWQKAITGITWSAQSLQKLETKVDRLTDEIGNQGESAVHADVVNAAPVYLNTYVAGTGTVTDFAYSQSATDGDAQADFREASTGASPVASDFYSTSQSADSAVLNPGNAIGSPNDNHATLPDEGKWVQVSGFSTAVGTITKVELAFEGQYDGTLGSNPDTVRLSYRVNTANGAAVPEFVPSATDAVTYIDVTGHRSWTWTDIGTTDIKATWEKEGALDVITILVDAVWLRVTYTETTYSMSIEGHFVGVPAAASHDVQLRYRVSGDTFRAQVWDGAAWNTRGADLTSATLATWSYTLASGEYNGGDPKIHFIDVNPTGGTQGHLWIEYGRVRPG